MISIKDFPVYKISTLVIGSGCAGLNAADWLYDFGQRDIALVTEGINMGTSRNTGSDKQTYYKLSLASDGQDSISEMAKTLFAGESVHGDTALAEAACSVRSFMKLANLGVGFPTNRYGEYVGYKTDHDPRQRATSAGPLTSKFMTQALETAVKSKQIRIFDRMQAVKLIVEKQRICGLLAINLEECDNENCGFTLFQAQNIILATGGPAAVYDTSVYPHSQTGMTGMALEAGAKAANIQEWQYGLASTKFRWNVSGTYQQVLPRFISVDPEGNEHEFLADCFPTPIQALDMVFLKGYQWPFDVRKLPGSSVIDIWVHHETVDKGNRVFMDFRTEPRGLEQGFESLSEEAYTYLKKSNALIPTPIKRLEKMNPNAIALYLDHGIDLYTQPLQVAVCAQHNNGGIAVDSNWQTNIEGLYAVGEAAGTFGVYRPGGSALNSTQVGSLRAAEHIAYDRSGSACQDFAQAAQNSIGGLLAEVEKSLQVPCVHNTALALRSQMQKSMSACCAHIRDPQKMEELYGYASHTLENFFEDATIKSKAELPQLLKVRDTLFTQCAILCAAWKTATEIGSRGSGMVLDAQGTMLSEQLRAFAFAAGKAGFGDQVLETVKAGNGFVSSFVPVRPIPQSEDWFENVWKEYRQRRGEK